MEVDTEEIKSDTASVIDIAGFSTIDEFTKVCQYNNNFAKKKNDRKSFENIPIDRLLMLPLLKDLEPQMHFLQVQPGVYMQHVLHLVKLSNFNRTRY